MVIIYRFNSRHHRRPLVVQALPEVKKEIEGEEIFPIQVHSEVYYFYYSVCYFYL